MVKRKRKLKRKSISVKKEPKRNIQLELFTEIYKRARSLHRIIGSKDAIFFLTLLGSSSANVDIFFAGKLFKYIESLEKHELFKEMIKKEGKNG